MAQKLKNKDSMTTKQIVALFILGFIAFSLIIIIGNLYIGANLPFPIFRSTNTSTPTLLPLDVNINLTIDLTTNIEKPIVSGNTNLPNGTIIMISVRGEANEYLAQDKVYVSNGTFKSSPFSLPTPSWAAVDNYYVEAEMPYANVQSESVRRIIGDAGEALRGKYVIRDSSGTLVQIKTTFKILPQRTELVGNDIGKRKVNEPNSDYSYAITLKSAYITNIIGTLIPMDNGFNGFVVVEIVYENLGLYPTDLRAIDFFLNFQDGLKPYIRVTSKGIGYVPSFLPENVQDPGYLIGVSINPNGSYHGWIVFENPSDTRNYVFTYKSACGTDCDNLINTGSAYKFVR